MQINTPHDAFFKSIMNDPEVAKSVLKSVLPANIYKLIDIDSLEPAKTDFVSDELKETFSDVVYTAKLKNGKKIYITFILEHKSHPDKFTPVQVLFYMASGYYTQYKSGKPLRVIVPLVFYHGKEKWEYKSLDSLFENVPEHLKKFIPTYKSIFIDLADMSDNQLDALEDSLVSAVLMLQKYALQPEELVKKLYLIFSKMNSVDRERNYFRKIIVYSLQLLDEEKVEKTIKELPVTIKNKVMTAYEALIKKGYDKGIEEGIEINKTQTIVKGYEAGASIEFLSTITDLSEEQVKKIIEEHLSKRN